MKSKASWFCAILFALFFLVTSLHIAAGRLLWFDEISAIRLAQLPDIASLWRIQNTFRGDSPPIVYHLLVRLFYALTGHSDIAARLLSALAMTAAMLVVFDIGRRLTDGIGGLIGMCVLGGSFLPFYGYEGRPYALIVLFTAIALWLWLFTKSESKPAAAAFGVTMLLAVTTHFNSVLAMVPFGVWELYRWRPWQKVSWKLVAGTAGMLAGLGLCVPQMRAFAGWSTSFWCPPTPGALVQVLTSIFPSGLFVLAAFGILICLVGTKAAPMGDAERLCWIFLSIPPAGYIVAELITNAFYDRYLIAILPGIAVAFACLAWRHLDRPASVALLLFLAVLVVGRQMKPARHPETIEPLSATGQQLYTRQALAAEAGLVADGKRTIITDFMLLQELRYYSRHSELYAMYDADAVPMMCKLFDSACWNLESVKAQAKEVAAFNPSDRLLSEMQRSGFRPMLKSTNPTIFYFSTE
jgi:hypothetical protein